MRRFRIFALGGLILGSTAVVGPGSALAQNAAPPSGAILDLNGQTIVALKPETYTISFTADAPVMTIAFAFRDDPSYIDFTNASLVDLTTSSTANLLKNGAFDQGFSNPGKGVPLPNDWVYSVISGSPDGGVSKKCGGAANCWVDGSVQGYDELGQEVEMTVGNTYQVSFTAEVLGGVSAWSRLSTNGDKSDAGGNGADILVYALNGKPIPEPSTWTMMGLGFAGLAYLGYRRRGAVASL